MLSCAPQPDGTNRDGAQLAACLCLHFIGVYRVLYTVCGVWCCEGYPLAEVHHERLPCVWHRGVHQVRSGLHQVSIPPAVFLLHTALLAGLHLRYTARHVRSCRLLFLVHKHPHIHLHPHAHASRRFWALLFILCLLIIDLHSMIQRALGVNDWVECTYQLLAFVILFLYIFSVPWECVEAHVDTGLSL